MMQLVRREPWWFAELERDMDRLVGHAFGPWPNPRWYRALVPADQNRWAPACDVFNRDGDLVIRMELPGIDPDKDVQVKVQDGVLCISGARNKWAVRGSDSYYRQEWSYGSFERSFEVPDGVATDDITACYDNGVLEVVVPRAAQLQEPKRIEVRSNGKKELAAEGV